MVVLAFASSATGQVPAGPEFPINSYTPGFQTTGIPGMAPNGDFVVVRQSDTGDGSGPGIFGRRFTGAGVPRGSEFGLNSYTTSSQILPHVTIGRRGEMIAVWESVQDGSGSSIQARRYDGSGLPLGPEFLVNSITTGDQYRPHVGRAADGRFVVSWRSYYADGSLAGIVAHRFDASGSPLGADFVANTYTTGFQGAGDLAVDAAGNFVVVWEDSAAHDGSSFGIFGQRYDAAGVRLGGEFQANGFTTSNQRLPSVSASPAGGFVVAWRTLFMDGNSYGVAVRRFDSAGSPVGMEFVANTFTTGYQAGLFGQVAHDARGNFVVAWGGAGAGDADGVFAQRFSAAGTPRGGEFRANTYTTANQRRPKVAADAVGNFVIAWESSGQDGSGYGVFAQRFGGLFPAALAVDGAGDQVLEPGETVDVRPSWRNASGGPQTFAATLSNIAGPPGATYAITDGIGDYGTVANGVAAQCADCFAVSVSNPPTRPAAHWDASAVESLVPDAQGQQLEWRLHVGDSFSDVPRASGFYRFIETLLHYDITGGCTATQYCPAAPTTREQMAVFVLVAKEGSGYVPPPCTTPAFPDVPPSNPFCAWIEELGRRGVVTGCGGGNYCPTAPVSREQMAVFVLRMLEPALGPPACVLPVYSDVPASSPFCRWIEELTRRGVVTGCGGGNYCPTASVTREQMGVFIGVTFGLSLYGP
jgi:hypothetical protein